MCSPPADMVFQSTLSMRRATENGSSPDVQLNISIHALHEESDQAALAKELGMSEFQSTLSMRRATGITVRKRLHSGISIHALHEESDISTPVNSSRR